MRRLRVDCLLQYTFLMRSRSSRFVVTAALLICFVCPLAETFDNWDHTIQTGNDTEYTLVVLALSVGAAYSFVRFAFKCHLSGAAVKSVAGRRPPKPFLSTPHRFSLLPFDPISPPPLRI